MKVAYYPGCTLQGSSHEYDESIKVVCDYLDVELVEIPDWSCCGASSAHATDHWLSIVLPARNLVKAEELGISRLLVPCAACYNRLKAAEKALKEEPEMYLPHVGAGHHAKYRGELAILHANDFFAQSELIEKLRKKVVKPLKNLRVVPYYGCLTARPPKVTDMEDYEDPKSMDIILEATGAQVKKWSFKTDCCGGNLAVTRTDILHRLCGRLCEMALEAGADCIVTDCPMCQSNLDTRQHEVEKEAKKRYDLPIFYVTELMALAMGEKNMKRFWKKHFVSPEGLLAAREIDS